jgi:methylated-DNA-[protein]-cysteine S-methyltransferase
LSEKVAAVACAPWPVPAAESRLWLAWAADGRLTHALWAAARAERPAELPAELAHGEPPLVVADLLAAYFGGAAVDPVSLPVAPAGSPFQLRVWQALRGVKRGHVRSYAGIAADIQQPRAMRAVGMANGRNPIAVVIPCHRVVEKDFTLGGYSSGLSLKRFLLSLEGVDVIGDVVRPGQLTLI